MVHETGITTSLTRPLTAGTSTSSVATTALTYNTNYALVITSLGSGTTATGLTLTDVSITPGESATSNSGTTSINNDAMVMNGKPTIMLNTGGPGDINHTYDFGLVLVPCSLSLVATPGVCLPATNQYTVTGTVSLTAAPASSLTITDGTATAIVSVSAGQTSATYSLSGLNHNGVDYRRQSSASFNLPGLTSGTGSHTVTVSGIGYSPVSTTYLAPTSCTVTIALSVTPGICSTATNQYSISGTLSLTNAVAGTATLIDGTASTTVTVSAGATSLPYSLTGLPSGTGSQTVTVSYVGQTASVLYTAPASGTVAPCVVAMIVTPGLCLSATNTYVLSGTVVATNVPTSGTLTISSGAFSSRTIAFLPGNDSVTCSYSGLVSNGQTYTVTASYSDAACAAVSQTYTAPTSCTVALVCSLSATASAGICATATNTYSATVAVAQTNGVAGTITISCPVRHLSVKPLQPIPAYLQPSSRV